MRRVKIPGVLLVLVAAIPWSAGAQLNPTVKVLPRATAPIPPECAEGLAPQPAQRLTSEERTIVRDTREDMKAPPSAGLHGQLQAAFNAARSGNRDLFRDSLVRAKSLLTSYPPGAERTAATNLAGVLDDVDRVWAYQFTSPTGAFFDSSSEPFRIASRYPGYENSVRRQVIVDQNGNRFYPTSETRVFLLDAAAETLGRLTGQKPSPRSSARGTTIPSATLAQNHTPATGSTTHEVRAAKPKPAPTHTPTNTRVHHAPRSTTHHPAPRAAQKPAKPPVVSTSAAPVTTPPAFVATQTAAPTPTPSVTSPSVTSPLETAPATESSTASTSATLDTSATTQPAEGEKPVKSRSFFWPLLLILVGVGVLVTLWRASS